MHFAGQACDMDPIMDIANRHNLLVIEDAAQGFGVFYKGKHTGTIGNCGMISFFADKTITCGEGGAVVTNEDDLYAVAHAFADHGHDHLGSDRGADRHPILGTNYRISELNAAVGLAQLRKLDRILEIPGAGASELLASLPDLLAGRWLREVPAGSSELPNAALGALGGGESFA